MCLQCNFQRWDKAFLFLRVLFIIIILLKCIPGCLFLWRYHFGFSYNWYFISDSVSTCQFYCSTSVVYWKNGAGYLKKKHYNKLTAWSSWWYVRIKRLASHARLVDDGPSDQWTWILNFICAMPASLKHKLQLYILLVKRSFMGPGYTQVNESESGGYALWAVFHRCIFCFYEVV